MCIDVEFLCIERFNLQNYYGCVPYFEKIRVDLRCFKETMVCFHINSSETYSLMQGLQRLLT